MSGGATRRVNAGRGHSYRLGGAKVPGVTTIIGDGVPKPALTAWAARETATFAYEQRETLLNLDQAAAVDLLKGAPYRERDKAARRGTEVHRLAEQLVRDVEVDVPEELAGHVESYLQFLDDWAPEAVHVELVVGHRTHRWMGTLDLIADLNTGERWLLDIKTTRSGVFGETALQLAAYRHAQFFLDDAGVEQPMIPVDRCGVIWVRADGYDLVPVTADADVYRYFRAAQWIATFATETSRTVIGDALTPGGPT